MAAMETMVRVGKAACGRGVFAKRAIRKGTLVGLVQGRVLDDPGYFSDYCIDLGGSLSLEPRAPFRYLNHCCEPNAQLLLTEKCHKDGSSAPSIVHVKALRAIKIGEELTIDYAWISETPIRCLCGASSCRGWVVAANHTIA
ncbi:MAG: SET domain-containing protein [Planctomycetia bacterium]|nr:SET domain-containing protein [Planctomycetia bacterium]